MGLVSKLPHPPVEKSEEKKNSIVSTHEFLNSRAPPWLNFQWILFALHDGLFIFSIRSCFHSCQVFNSREEDAKYCLVDCQTQLGDTRAKSVC